MVVLEEIAVGDAPGRHVPRGMHVLDLVVVEGQRLRDHDVQGGHATHHGDRRQPGHARVEDRPPLHGRAAMVSESRLDETPCPPGIVGTLTGPAPPRPAVSSSCSQVTRVRNIVLLNPPGRLRYIRDQFCSHVSKASYYWQPLDLLVLSGHLQAEGYDLAVVDAIAERLAPAAAARRVAAFAPDAVIFLTGSDSFADDVRFVAGLKQGGVSVAVGIGDILRDRGAELLERHPVIDACLNDFVTHGLARFLEGRLEEAENMTVRTPAGIRTIAARPRTGPFTLPVPRYGLFPLRRYRMPFNRHHPYATVIASSWCPFGCRFCPFARTAFRLREVDDVLSNLEAIRRLGIRQVHFADWTFGVNRKHTTTLLQGMIAARFGFTWSCLSRVDLVDHEMLALFAEAGADLVEFGVESGSQAILDRYQKRITIEQVRAAFRSCSRAAASRRSPRSSSACPARRRRACSRRSIWPSRSNRPSARSTWPARAWEHPGDESWSTQASSTARRGRPSTRPGPFRCAPPSSCRQDNSNVSGGMRSAASTPGPRIFSRRAGS